MKKEFKIKVYKLSHYDLGFGYLIDNPEHLEVEFKDAGYYDETLECAPWSKEKIKSFIEKIKNLKVGEKVDEEPWVVECTEMNYREFENLEEFSGW